MPEQSSEPVRYLYRGIHADHPAFADALNGIVTAADPESPITPEEHNLRWKSGESCYTSWTSERRIAENYAGSKGPGGLLLRVGAGAPEPDAGWQWEGSPDHWLEGEVLLRGTRIGVEVIRL